MSARDPIWPDQSSLALLLAPLPGNDPCGPSLRYDAVMAQIRGAREADDPSLPMGDWERPLKRADWPAVQTMCVELLAYRSKDLQAAAWLLDASLTLQQAQGLQTGILLLCGLVEQHWAHVHPRIADDGDADARVAPLVWLNDTLPLTLQLQFTLLPLPGRKPARLTLDDWERLSRAGTGTGADAEVPADAQGLPGRDELLRLAGRPAALVRLHALRDGLQQATAHWSRLNALIDAHLGREGPSLGRVADALARLQHALAQLIAGRAAPLPGAPGVATVASAEAADTLMDIPVLNNILLDDPGEPLGGNAEAADTPAEPGPAPAAAPAAVPVPAPALALTSRDAAYRTLQAVADYLQAIEPHSPTPYLVRRAISWGAMPLPQLMQEVLREEGDLNRLFAVLGLPQPKA